MYLKESVKMTFVNIRIVYCYVICSIILYDRLLLLLYYLYRSWLIFKELFIKKNYICIVSYIKI